jgi:class 3 adenylate cyclase
VEASLRRSLALGAAAALLAALAAEQRIAARVAREADVLESVAAEAAAGVDGDLHEQVRGPGDVEGPAFQGIRRQLRVVQEKHEIRSPVYTLRKLESGGGTEFVVMTNETPFVGHRYSLHDEMRPVFERGERGRNTMYGDAHGTWISGYGPIRDRNGRVVALVEVDRPCADLRALRWQWRILSILIGILVFAAARFGAAVLHERRGAAGVAGGLRRLVLGRISVRIAAAAALPVFLAVGVLAATQHQRAREEAFASVRERLLRVVRVAAPRVDPALHQALARSGDARTPAFLQIRQVLRDVKEQAGLQSTVYTLRRDGEGTRFVAMSSEVPFIGDAYELRAGVRATFDGGGAGTEGPYTDAHDTWISAWAPIPAPGGAGAGAGAIQAVLQVDEPVGALVLDLRLRLLRELLLAVGAFLLAAAVAAWLARSISRPIAALSATTERIGQGELETRAPEGRIDEVGQLASAVNRMAKGLGEREKLRDMFGKYMAGEVVRELLSRDELSLVGEELEITVLLSDIRGYTELTGKMGAKEIVALLNEHFGILVEAVMEEGGVVDKYMGDALLCWFGAPLPQADHEARALRAALRMMERLRAWNARHRAQGLHEVETGIGLAAGHVVVGNIGSERRFEYTAIGDAVNMASRLCHQAKAKEIVATGQVRRKAEASGVAPDWTSMGAVAIKGVAEPMELWKVQG